jgi:6-phosphogluconolactonase
MSALFLTTARKSTVCYFRLFRMASNNSVSAFAIGANGALTPVPGAPFPAGFAPVSVVVEPAAKFVFVANKISNNVSAYRIDPGGSLTPVPGSPFPAGIGPLSVAVDSAARFVNVANNRKSRP